MKTNLKQGVTPRRLALGMQAGAMGGIDRTVEIGGDGMSLAEALAALGYYHRPCNRSGYRDVFCRDSEEWIGRWNSQEGWKFVKQKYPQFFGG